MTASYNRIYLHDNYGLFFCPECMRRKDYRMPCPHYRIKISKRSKSPPTTASAAYQSGERLYDKRTHRTKDYNDKRGGNVADLVHLRLLLLRHTPARIGREGLQISSGTFRV